MPKPVVAMVAGFAVGGGHILHMICDLTVSARLRVFVSSALCASLNCCGRGSHFAMICDLTVSSHLRVMCTRELLCAVLCVLMCMHACVSRSTQRKAPLSLSHQPVVPTESQFSGLQIAADNAVFGQTGPKVGSFDAGYGSTHMARLIGEGCSVICVQ